MSLDPEEKELKQARSQKPQTEEFLQRKTSDTVRSEKSPAGVLLQNFLEFHHTAGEEKKESYNYVLNELRKKPEEVIIEITRAEQKCSRNDFGSRWGLIFAASELKSPASLPFLKSIVLTPIPPEQSAKPEKFSTVEEETIIRTTAVDGVRHLAEQGDEKAFEMLYEFLDIPSISIRRAAVLAMLSSRKDKKTRQLVEESLPKNMRFLLDLKPVDVREMKQIEQPQDTLIDPEREIKLRTPPKLGSEQGKKKSRVKLDAKGSD